MKVFISNIDSPLGHNLSRTLSRTVPGSRLPQEVEEEPPADQVEDEQTVSNPATKEKKECYQIYGSLITEFPESQNMAFTPAKPGRMIETGDPRKDAARREAIEKIPIRGKQPNWISDAVPGGDKDKILDLMLESDVIIYDVLDYVDEAVPIMEALVEKIETFEAPKIVVLISSVMSWARTKVDPDDPETPIPEDEYRRRKPHPNFKAIAQLEKDIVKHSKKEKFKGYVVTPGLVYHSGDSIFHTLLKMAWHNEPFLPCYGDGNNVLPCIHLDDLANIVVEVVDTSPEPKYILATDDSKSTLYEIVKAVADNLSNGAVKKLDQEDAFLNPEITQQQYDLLTTDLRLETGWIKEAGIELKYESGLIENISSLIQEYKDSRGLWPIKIILHGPPASGKSILAQKLAAEYKIHNLEPTQVVQDAMANLEKRLQNVAQEGDDYDPDADKDFLNELKENIKSAGKASKENTMNLVMERLKSKPCLNQGYVLDGYPNFTDEANELFKSLRDDSEDGSDNSPNPEFVFSLEASDLFIKSRIMKLPESQITALNNEEALTKRLEEFRRLNTDELTVLNVFDEMEVTPIQVMAETSATSKILDHMFKAIGPPRTYGKSTEELAEELKKAEKIQAEEEAIYEEKKRLRDAAEVERAEKAALDWKNKLEQIRKEEKDILEVQSEPLRNYLVKYVMPTLTAGLVEVAKVRPEDPIDYLAEYLFKENTGNGD